MLNTRRWWVWIVFHRLPCWRSTNHLLTRVPGNWYNRSWAWFDLGHQNWHGHPSCGWRRRSWCVFHNLWGSGQFHLIWQGCSWGFAGGSWGFISPSTITWSPHHSSFQPCVKNWILLWWQGKMREIHHTIQESLERHIDVDTENNQQS